MSRPPEFAAPPRAPSEIATPTKCRHCGKVFYGPRAVLKVGEQPPQRFFKYLAEINEHIVKAHPMEFERAYVLGTEFQGMLLLSNYVSEDAEIVDQRNFYRWKVHQASLAARVPDAAIHQKACEAIEGVFATPSLRIKEELIAAVEKQMRELRDILEEPGRYEVSALTGEGKEAKPPDPTAH